MALETRTMQADLYEYKQKVISLLLSNEEIVGALEATVDASELVYENIFPFGVIDDTQKEARALITVEVTMPQVSTVNNFYKDVLLVINVICHNDMMKMDTQPIPRHDYLSAKICELLDGNTELVAVNELQLVSNTEGAYGERHSGRTMRFKAVERLRSYC